MALMVWQGCPWDIFICPIPIPSQSNLCLSHPMGRFPWDSHRNAIPMDKPRVVHGTYLSVPFPSHSNLCLSHPMGHFPWDSHRNDIPMDKPAVRKNQHVLVLSQHPSYFKQFFEKARTIRMLGRYYNSRNQGEDLNLSDYSNN